MDGGGSIQKRLAVNNGPLEIIYRDEQIIAINKPHGLLVHRTKIATERDVFALQLLRDQIGQRVYPVHRIDRKTSGILLFALNEDVNARLSTLFREQQIAKTYWAIVRGFTDATGTIDYALKKDNGQLQESITHYKTLAQTEIPVPLGKFETSRYSLVEVQPETGRMHQIRKHLAHIHHPIIADRPHGCNKQNRLFKDKWSMDSMLLHAKELEFKHPVTHDVLRLRAKISSEFERTLSFLKFEKIIS
ncbi:tRNA pseudouridine65 synthase [Marivirga sericea]|uniref:tRNA pseudouridine synthase C n=1 Tax=Marivirga sericea TaxID=1028 RepID=A0A1X7IA61_9BACT|nr:pseudouridine synthase [Marivirga sericea]SMG10917.1 tRNA pseudouridine65 synthase [Marivirga sericea]